MMPDKEDPIKPLGKIIFFGKGEGKQPFPIAGMKWKGLYYYILVDDLQQLLKINARYKSIRRQAGVEPLREVRLIGGGNVIGYKPFLYRGEQCVCILADHLKQLVRINKEYKKLFRQRIIKKSKAKSIKRVIAKPVKKVEEPEAPHKLIEKRLVEAKEVKAKKIKLKPVKKTKERPKRRIRKLKPKSAKPKKIKKVKKPKPRRIVRPKRIKKVRKTKPVPKKKRKIIKPKKVKLAKKPKKILRKIKPRPKKRTVRKKIVRRKVRKISRSQQPKLLKGLRRFFRI